MKMSLSGVSFWHVFPLLVKTLKKSVVLPRKLDVRFIAMHKDWKGGTALSF
jgi:hypothetical protein